MGRLQKIKEIATKLLEWYEHAKSILELLGLDWRDLRDAATLTGAVVPLIHLQDLPVQWLGLSVLATFVLSLMVVYYGVKLWKLGGASHESPRLLLWHAFRRFVNITLTVGLAVSWYYAGKKAQINEPPQIAVSAPSATLTTPAGVGGARVLPAPAMPMAQAPPEGAAQPAPLSSTPIYTAADKERLFSALKIIDGILTTGDRVFRTSDKIPDFIRQGDIPELQKSILSMKDSLKKMLADIFQLMDTAEYQRYKKYLDKTSLDDRPFLYSMDRNIIGAEGIVTAIMMVCSAEDIQSRLKGPGCRNLIASSLYPAIEPLSQLGAWVHTRQETVRNMIAGLSAAGD